MERAGAALPLWKIRNFPRVNILPPKGGAAAPRAARPLTNAARFLLWYNNRKALIILARCPHRLAAKRRQPPGMGKYTIHTSCSWYTASTDPAYFPSPREFCVGKEAKG